MTNTSDGSRNTSRRTVVAGGIGMFGVAGLRQPAAALPAAADPAVPPETPPSGYNILFILVDQEHFFDRWPVPVPGREWIKRNGITFTNHQAASCVCSPARSTIYTGRHIQHTGVFDNAGFLGSPTWQPRSRLSVIAWRCWATTHLIRVNGT